MAPMVRPESSALRVIEDAISIPTRFSSAAAAVHQEPVAAAVAAAVAAPEEAAAAAVVAKPQDYSREASRGGAAVTEAQAAEG